jgi:ubiquinone/menaquinone biosynthesis C-methylase UbiE
MLDRKKHWKNVYLNKSTLDVSWFQEKPALSLKLISHSQLSPDAPIIDVGGASTLVDHLQHNGHSNIGVLDISAEALTCAKKRIGNKAKNIEWYEEDILNFNPPQPYSLWHDRAVFHF